jgi:hypothetical protein
LDHIAFTLARFLDHHSMSFMNPFETVQGVFVAGSMSSFDVAG